jgi:hypothetical protein
MRTPVKLTRQIAGEYWPEIVILARGSDHPSTIVHHDEIVCLKTIAADIVDRAIAWHRSTAIELFGEFTQTPRHDRSEAALRDALRNAR